MEGARLRLIVYERDDVGGLPGLLGWEKLVHGIKRDEAAKVQVHIVAVPNLLQSAHDLEADSVKQNSAANGGTPVEKCAADLVSDDHDRALLGVVHVIDPAAF